MQAVIALVRKDLLQHFSNRRALLMSLAAPILIAIFFGSLFGNNDSKPAHIPIAITDLDRSDLSARVIADLRADTTLKISLLDAAAAQAQVQDGTQRAAVTLPAGFGAQAVQAMLGAGPRPEIALTYDPSQSMVLPMVRGLLAQHVMRPLMEGRGQSASMPFTTREVQAAGTSESAAAGYNSYAHSFAGMGVQFILMMGIDMGIGLLTMRRLGLWKRLRAAPLSRTQLLGSRIGSCALIALLTFAAIYAVAFAFFGVRVAGSAVGFVAVLLAFALLTASFGLMVAALGRTPEATRGLAIVATLLLVMLGGAWVPSFVFPPWLQTVSAWVPTHWAIEGLDGMTWRGLPLQSALLPVAVMLGFTAAFGALALARFDWEE